MKLTKELLEEGVIIKPNGDTRKYHKNARIQEGELVVLFSKRGVQNELKNDGFTNVALKRKKIFIGKSKKQAVKEALLSFLYFT